MHIVSFVFNLHLVSHLKHHKPEKLLPTQRDMELTRLDRCYRAEYSRIDNGYYWQDFVGWSYERYKHYFLMEQGAGSGRSSDSEEDGRSSDSEDDGILPDSDSDGRCSLWGAWDVSLEEDGRSSGSGADVEPVRPEHRHREGLI